MQKVYAHRGASGYAPENTLEAFELAVQQGAHGVELDVHLSRDGEIVVAHDETIDRVSSGTGRIQDMTVAELKRYQFSNGMSAYQRATIPTLREVYELLKPTGLCVNVELKNGVIHYPELERKCIELAAEMGMKDRVLYSSFNHHSMVCIKELDASVPCGLLYDSIMVKPWRYASQLGVDALHPHYRQLMLPNICGQAHQAGIKVNVWTINEESIMQRVCKEGVDIIITNYPDRALAVVAERGGNE